MSTINTRTRSRNATALFAAAVAVLLSACAQEGSTPTARAEEAQATTHAATRAVEAATTEAMPEVVIVASREGPDTRG